MLSSVTTHRIACFVRIDLEVSGTPSLDFYDDVSEWVQDLVQEALLAPPRRYELEGMTCRIAGPLDRSDELANGETGEEFAPLLEILSHDIEELG